MLTALQRQFTKISSENSDENGNGQFQLQCLSAGQTMTETEKSSDLGEIAYQQ